MRIKFQQFLFWILILVFAGCSAPDVAVSKPGPDAAKGASLISAANLFKDDLSMSSAQINQITGSVQVRQAGNEPFSAALNGMQLLLNGEIQTGPDGWARLDFSDGTLVRVSPDSHFSLDAISQQDQEWLKQLSLEFGQLWIVLNGGELQVQTASGTAAVRGSYMMVEQDPAGDQMLITCLEGTCVLVVGAEQVTLSAGEKAWLSGGRLETGLMSQEDIQAWLDSTPEAELVLYWVPGSIGNFVWEDLNGNGQQDQGEPGVEGVSVNLFTGQGELLQSTQTDSDGFYLFDDLLTGDYSIEFLYPNTLFTPQYSGSNTMKDSDVYPTGRTALFNLEPGQHRSDLDAGMVYPGHAAVCPLTGLPTDADLLDNRPIFISISHFPAWATRPSTGLNSAPVVFETLIDEGQTRLQALFYCGYPHKLTQNDSSPQGGGFDISGVRSGRVFYAELAQLFGAGLIFGGASAEVYNEIAPYQCGVVDNTGIPQNIGAAGLDIKSLQSIAENCKNPRGNTQLDVWTFGPAPAGGEQAGKFLMHYNYLNQTRWEYSPQAGGYVRYQNDPEAPNEFTLSTDKLTGEAVVRQNLLVLEVPHEVLNRAGTIIDFNLTNERGYAWLLREGAMYSVCWSAVFDDYATASNRYRPFLLYDCATKEAVNLAYGGTWVNVVDPSFWFEQNGDYLTAKQPFLGYGP